MLRLVILAMAALPFAHAACPNQCSGHGSCGNDDICHCYQDWLNGDEEGGDCSKRKCPYAPAWVDTPSMQNKAHALAECSNRGVCDRDSGDCQCFDGYTGSACRRTTCPNDCSGHGTCEYIRELRNDLGDDFKWTGDKPTTDQFQHEITLMWDESKSRACVCDPKWTDIDCSRRMCPKGNYALYYDGGSTDTDGAISGNSNIYTEVQTVAITSKCDLPLTLDSTGMRVWGLSAAASYDLKVNGGSPSDQTASASVTGTGFLKGDGTATDASTTPAVGDYIVSAKFLDPTLKAGVPYTQITAITDPLNTFTINQAATGLAALAQNDIVTIFPASSTTGNRCQNVEFALTFRSTLNEEFTTKTLRQTDTALTVQQAINSLPNKVVEEVAVTKTDTVATESTSVTKTEFSITFAGSMTTGDQYALECRTKPCGAGCNPRISNVLDAQIMANPYGGDNFDQFDTIPAYGSAYTNAAGSSNYVGKVYAVVPDTAAAASAVTLTGLCPALQVGMNMFSAATDGSSPAATAIFDDEKGYEVASFTDATGVCVVTLSGAAHGITFTVEHLITFEPASFITLAAPVTSKYIDIAGAAGGAANSAGAVSSTSLNLPQVGDTLMTWGDNTKTFPKADHSAGTGVMPDGTTTVVAVTGTLIELSQNPKTGAMPVATDVLVFKRAGASAATFNYGTARTVTRGGTCTVTDDTMLDKNSPKKLKAVNTECSTRGHCAYDTGICQCFEGYTDEYCSTQAALI